MQLGAVERHDLGKDPPYRCRELNALEYQKCEGCYHACI